MIAEPLRGLARPVGDLKFLPGNPRRGDVAACKRSLKRFGQRKPIVVRDDGNSCPPGGTVYEPFGGSGAVLIAAHRLGRTCYAMELDPHFADVICCRYQGHAGAKPILEATGEPHDFMVGT